MKEHRNTHRLTPDCRQHEDYVLGTIGERTMVGVSFGPGGWKPARIAYSADLHYFGVKAQPHVSKGEEGNG